MSSNTKNVERREYLKNNCDKILTDLLSQLAFHRPTNVVQFLHDYSAKKMSEDVLDNASATEAVPQDVRKSCPKLVYEEDNQANGETQPEE